MGHLTWRSDPLVYLKDGIDHFEVILIFFLSVYLNPRSFLEIHIEKLADLHM